MKTPSSTTLFKMSNDAGTITKVMQTMGKNKYQHTFNFYGPYNNSTPINHLNHNCNIITTQKRRNQTHDMNRGSNIKPTNLPDLEAKKYNLMLIE